MILASHQPNFAPYMGFFYKMYVCDVFSLSDGVQYSSAGFQSYNYIMEQGKKKKLVIPVHKKLVPISEIELSEFSYEKRKLLKRLYCAYHKSPHFIEVFDVITTAFDKEIKYLAELNKNIIYGFADAFGIKCDIVSEKSMQLSGSATEQIDEICKITKCKYYLSGIGAKEYLGELKNAKVLWTNYVPIEGNLSVFDYAFNEGFKLPNTWEIQKGEIIDGLHV